MFLLDPLHSSASSGLRKSEPSDLSEPSARAERSIDGFLTQFSHLLTADELWYRPGECTSESSPELQRALGGATHRSRVDGQANFYEPPADGDEDPPVLDSLTVNLIQRLFDSMPGAAYSIFGRAVPYFRRDPVSYSQLMALLLSSRSWVARGEPLGGSYGFPEFWTTVGGQREKLVFEAREIEAFRGTNSIEISSVSTVGACRPKTDAGLRLKGELNAILADQSFRTALCREYAAAPQVTGLTPDLMGELGEALGRWGVDSRDYDLEGFGPGRFPYKTTRIASSSGGADLLLERCVGCSALRDVYIYSDRVEASGFERLSIGLTVAIERFHGSACSEGLNGW